MKAGVAAPVALLEEYASRGDYHLALSHMIRTSDEYREFYTEEAKTKRVGVDNGVVEQGESLPLWEVLEAAHTIGAHEIVLPDVLGDAKASAQATYEALEWMARQGCLGDLDLMGVPHGATWTEWLECYLFLLTIPEITIIGISMFDSELLEPQGVYSGRPLMLNLLDSAELIDCKRQYHMLGCWKDLREAYALSVFPFFTHEGVYGSAIPRMRPYVRSMDTGMPVRLGQQGIYHPVLASTEAPAAEFVHRKEDFLAPHEPTKASAWNVDRYIKYCHGETDSLEEYIQWLQLRNENPR